MAKRSTGTQIIENPRTEEERWLIATVQELSTKAGIKMPEVGIFPSYQSNAFATGWNKNAALVAVSTGLLQRMSRDEVKAVLGHEIGHVANGDMVTLSLIQGVVNTFVMFGARVVGGIIDRAVFRSENNRGGGIGYFVSVMVLQIVFGIAASAVVMWFSRQREYRADAGGARLAGREKMIGALQRLAAGPGAPLPGQLQAFGIAGGRVSGFQRLFMSHPPLEDRIARLRGA